MPDDVFRQTPLEDDLPTGPIGTVDVGRLNYTSLIVIRESLDAWYAAIDMTVEPTRGLKIKINRCHQLRLRIEAAIAALMHEHEATEARKRAMVGP